MVEEKNKVLLTKETRIMTNETHFPPLKIHNENLCVV